MSEEKPIEDPIAVLTILESLRKAIADNPSMQPETREEFQDALDVLSACTYRWASEENEHADLP